MNTAKLLTVVGVLTFLIITFTGVLAASPDVSPFPVVSPSPTPTFLPFPSATPWGGGGGGGGGGTNPTPTLTPTPTPTIIPTQNNANGELYLWIGFWLSPGDSSAQRIVNARDSSGIPIWLDTGNWGSPQLTSSFINYFHAHGVKIVCRLWSGGTVDSLVPLDTILHSMSLSGHSRGSVDYQLSIGPEIDAFMIDEVDPANVGYYRSIADYVHSKGKLLFLNPGGSQYNTAAITAVADKISAEYLWWGYKNGLAPLLAANPEKFIGVSKDYGYSMNPIYDPYLAPRSASGDRPAWYAPMSMARALWDTKTAWDSNIFCMAATPEENGRLPDWWEQYIMELSYG